MKVAFVVPRYGADVIGGAETAVRMLAERLASRPGMVADVYTTCARDLSDWGAPLPAGTTVEAGVTVHRFAVTSGRDPSFLAFSDDVFSRGASHAEALRWIDLQGPVSPGLVEALAASDADVAVFSPYLYWPTVAGARAVTIPYVLHAAAHDEPPLHLPVFPELFRGAGGLAFYTEAERRLVEGFFGVAHANQVVVGLGVDVQTGDPAARDRIGVADDPYLVCVGRMDAQKGVPLLTEWFAAFKRRHDGPLKLVLVGPADGHVQSHPDIIVAGIVDEATKWGLLRGALALVSLSFVESFSLAVLEAWAAGVPVVVNAKCAATTEHCRRSGGGVPVASYAQFEAVVERFCADAALCETMAARGSRYAEQEYGWDAVMDRYTAFLSTVAAAARTTRPAPRRQHP